METYPFLAVVGAGRFDAPHDAVQARCERAATFAPLYFATEVMPDQRKAFHAPGHKSLFVSEFACQYDPEVYEPVGLSRVNWLTKRLTFNRGHIRIRAREGTFRLRHKASGRVGYFDVNHLPAHIQNGDTFVKDPKLADEIAAHKRAVYTAGQKANRRKRRHPDRFQFWCGDVNLDQHRARWRGYMEIRLGLYPVWRKATLPKPGVGDLGPRLITGAWTYAIHHTRGHVLPRTKAEAGLDHAMTVIEGTLQAAH